MKEDLHKTFEEDGARADKGVHDEALPPQVVGLVSARLLPGSRCLTRSVAACGLGGRLLGRTGAFWEGRAPFGKDGRFGDAMLRRCYVWCTCTFGQNGPGITTRLVGAEWVSSGPRGLQPTTSYFLTCHSLDSRGT